mgnify:CR=1 FL=1
MAVRAYVLIEASIGKVSSAAENIRALPGVVAADAVAGPYDIIATVEANSADAVGRLVMEKIHAVAGVSYTMTCVVVS